MANTSKTYTISIQMDAAQQALADANKKLAELDKSLDGLDRNSDAAKAIVAEMAKLAKQAESAEGQVQGLASRLDGLKPGTIGALRAEFLELKAALDLTVEGSAQADAVLRRMGEVKGEIKGLRDEVKALDPEQRINAFNNLASGVVGAFGVMTVAAETFGLSSTAADEFIKKTQGVIAVLGSLEAIRNSLDGETIKSIKSTLSLGKAYLTAGEGASTGAKVTRAALISTGIGILIIGVGLLVANWDRLTASVKGSEAFFTKVKAILSGLFDSAIPAIKTYGALLGDLFTGNLVALVADAQKAGKTVGDAYAKGYQESVAESHRKELEGLIDQQDRRIKVLKAGGQATDAIERDNLQRRVNLQKQGTKEYIEALTELGAFDRAAAKKRAEQALALEAATLAGLASLRTAAGKDAFAEQLAAEQQKLIALKSAAVPERAAIEAQQFAIQALTLAHEKTLADKAKAAREKQIQEEYQAFLKRNQALESMQAISAQDRLRLDIEAEQKRLGEIAKIGQQAGAQAVKILEDQAKEGAERARIAAIKPLSFLDNVLVKVFGVSPDQLDATKQAIASAAQEVGNLVGGIFNAQQAAADERLAQAQQRVQEVDAQYQAAAQASEATAKQLDTAKGARRDYLLGKLEKERAAESRLASEKAKAAKEQEQAAKVKAGLEKQQQQISAASTAIEAILLGIEAARAIASAAKAGKVGFDNIAFAIGATAALVTGFVAVKNAAKLADGGILEGPSHSQGGIRGTGRFNNIEVEGGEGVLPVDATHKNHAAFELMRTAGRTRTLTLADFASIGQTRVLPPPNNRFANGGVLPGGGGLPAGAVVVQSADLAELIDTNRQMLARLDAVASHTGDIRNYGPPVLAFGYEAEMKRRQLSGELDATKDAARL